MKDFILMPTFGALLHDGFDFSSEQKKTDSGSMSIARCFAFGV